MVANINLLSITYTLLFTFQLVNALPIFDAQSSLLRRAPYDDGHRNSDGTLRTRFPSPVPVVTSAWAQQQSLSRREVAEDIVNLSRRAPSASPCSELDLDDLEALPGWPALQKYARDTWGDGDYDVVINPPGYKDKPAMMCVADPVKIAITGPYECNETRVDIPPLKGTKTIRVDLGYTNIGNWNITNVTSVAHSAFLRGTFQMPHITNLTMLNSIKAPGVFINAPENSFTTTATNKTIKDTQLTPVPNKKCIGTVNNEHCRIPAAGRIQLVASGYIWFNYKTKRAPLINPKAAKHWRYTVKIEDVLKNATDRSAYIDFNGFMNTTMRSDYFDECRWNFKL